MSVHAPCLAVFCAVARLGSIYRVLGSVRGWTGLALLVAVLAMPAIASADRAEVYKPEPREDLYDLDHHFVYEWGLDILLGPGEEVSAAELFFDEIRNWDDQPNDLYIHLLDWAGLGVVTHHDAQGGGDYFANTYAADHMLIEHREDLPDTPDDITYTFSPDEVALLNTYLADGRTGLGFDPDCHYYNCGVEFRVTVVPEPGSLASLAVGALALLRRRRL